MTRPKTALLASITLHAALLLVIASIRYDGEITSTPGVVHVELVRFYDGSDADERGARAAGEPSSQLTTAIETPPPAPPSEAEAVAAEPTPPAAVEPEARKPEPAEIDPEPASEARVAARDEAQPANSETPETRVEPTVAVAEVVAPPPPPAEPEPSVLEPAPERAPEVLAVAPPTEPIPQAQRRMLDRKIAEWAESFDELEATATSIAWEHDGQEYRASVTRLPAADNMAIEQAVIAVSTERDGNRWSSEMRLKRLAFSSFAQFVDRWDPEVQVHDDEIDGRFHANSEIYISRSGGVQPSFLGRVTTARGINTTHSEARIRRDEVFLGGLETRVRRIMLPPRFAPFPEDAEDEERVRRFDADARIVFYADGTYGWRYLESAAPEERVALGAEPHYLVAADKAELLVRGVVDGKVLVYSPEGIVVEDDLVYAADPKRDATADDYLGLVSDKDVEIAEPDTTGPGDLTVHASIFAKRRFVVRSFRANERATLYVHGSVTAGAVSATEPRYRTKLAFDERLEKLRPPRFPVTDRYEVAAWDGRWTAEPEDADF